MESLGYVFIYFLRGSLPWEDLESESQEQQKKLMLERKQTTTPQELCKDLPEEFKDYFSHVRSLGYNEKPNYADLRCRFGNLFRRKGYEYDDVFDWTELRFLEYLERSRKGSEEC